MNIGEVSTQTGLPAKTIRYYEEIGLVRPQRDGNGYRRFRDVDAHKLSFLANARALGFSIEDCRALLALWEDRSRASHDVRRIAKAHLDEIDAKVAGLQAMRRVLAELVSACHGDTRPDCPILTELGGAPGETA